MERKKITRSEEFKKRVGDFHRGKTVSEETRRKISEANKGKTFSGFGTMKSMMNGLIFQIIWRYNCNV